MVPLFPHFGNVCELHITFGDYHSPILKDSAHPHQHRCRVLSYKNLRTIFSVLSHQSILQFNFGCPYCSGWLGTCLRSTPMIHLNCLCSSLLPNMIFLFIIQKGLRFYKSVHFNPLSLNTFTLNSLNSSHILLLVIRKNQIAPLTLSRNLLSYISNFMAISAMHKTTSS